MKMNLQQWREGGDYIEYQGHRIFYRVEGQGHPLLMIHGYPTSSWDWLKIWHPLTKGYQCITMDMLGFGFSDKPRLRYSIFQQADIFAHVLTHLEIKRCHILSHDYGDTVAQELLARFNAKELPFEIDSVTLLNGGLFPETHHPVFIQKMLISPIGGLLVKLMSKTTLSKNMRNIFGPDTQPSDEELNEFWKLITFKEGHLIMHRLIRYMQERKQFRDRWVGALQQTEVPLCLINGLADPISGRHMLERYLEIVPNPKVIRLDSIGHYPQVEAPEAVQNALIQHIESSSAE